MDGAAGAREMSRDDDGVLLAQARSGSDEAYGLLFERHRAMAMRFARSKLSDPSNADDVVAEVFASVLSTIKRGGGPIDVFVPYLMTSLRNQCQRVNQQQIQQLALVAKEHTATATGHSADVAADEGEVDIVRDAFQSLPAKFQDVLWRVEVDEEPYEALATRYRMTPHAVAMLTLRARRALASAYLDRHRPLPQPGQIADKACRAVAHDLTGLTRGTLGFRRRKKVEAHIAHCESCRTTHAELGRLNRHLRVLPIAPLALLGDAATTGTKAGVQSYLSMCWATAAPVVTSGVAAVTLVSPVLLSGAQGDRSVASSATEPLEHDDSTNQPRPGSTVTSTPATTASSTMPMSTSSNATATSTSTATEETSTTVLAATITGVTAPRPTTPGAAQPPTAAPRRNPPTITTPAITVPPPVTSAATLPPVTAPPLTLPPVTAPPVTAPPVTAPPVTAPPVTLPQPPPLTAPPGTELPPIVPTPVAPVSAPPVAP